MAKPPSVPETNAENETRIATFAAFIAHEGGGLAVVSSVGEANVGRELARDFVSYSKAGIELGKAGSDFPARVRLVVKVHFYLGLSDKALSYQDVVGCLDPAGHAPAIAEVKGRLQFEKVRRQTLNPNRTPP